MAQQENVYRNILESMRDGVMTIGPDGRIVTFNCAAERILGVPQAEALGHTLAELFLTREGSDEFTETILAAVYEQERTHTATVQYRTDAERLTLSVTTSFLQSREAEGGKRAVIAVFADVSEVARLRQAEQQLAEELRANHAKLQGSYCDLEATTQRLQAALRKVRVIRIASASFLVLAAAAVGGAAWHQTRSIRHFPASPAPAAAGPATQRSVTVAPAPLTDRIGLKGHLKPVKVVTITSPFGGMVAERLVEFGQAVEKGQPLLRLSTVEAEVKAREARAAFIKAAEALRQLEGWAQGDEVAKARRSLTRSKLALDAQQRTLDETRRLFEKGIVPAGEVASAEQQHANNRMDYESVEQELKITLAKGAGDGLSVARLELENARVKLAEIEGQIAQAEVRSPLAGTVIRPDLAGKDGRPKALEQGATFSQGEVLLSIGDTGRLSATADVDEMEVLRIRQGQAVRISGDAFPGLTVAGTVSQISSQAGKGEGSGGGDRRKNPTFELTVTTGPLGPTERQRLRLGMSASLEVVILDKPDAILVPISAVQGEGAERFVLVKEPGTGQPRRVKVETGATTLDAVEIVRGLQRGDEVLVRN